MKKTFAFLWGVLTSVAVEAQEKFHFSVDRPGIADLPTIIPSKSFQLETGVEFYRREQGDNIYLPTTLIRYGIIKPMELRVSTRLQRFTVRNESGQTRSLGLNPLTVGVKTSLLRERGWFPATSLVTDLTIPQTGVRKFREQRVGSSALILMENNIHDQILINYNIGVQWSGAPGELTTMYAVCLEYEINGTNAALFVEQSTFFHNQTKDDYWIDAGYTHLVTPASQVDISSGIDLNGGPLDFFVAVGYSLRLGFIE